MIPLPNSFKLLKKGKNLGIFEIKPLYPGYGITIGNALRRVLLSSLEGAAITEVRIKNVAHEFSTIPGVLEDVILILMNLKKVRFSFFAKEAQTITLAKKGEGEVKAKDFKTGPQIKIANPDCHIATLTSKKAELVIEAKVEKGVGYQPVEIRESKKAPVGTIYLDAIFTPIRRVAFRIENIRVGRRTDFDRLELEIETDGTITPKDALSKGSEILLKHFELIKKEDFSSKR